MQLSPTSPLAVVADAFLSSFALRTRPDAKGHCQRSPGTLRVYKDWLRRLGRLGHRPVAEVTTPEIIEWHDDVLAELGPASAMHAHAVVRVVFTFARRRGLCGINPACALGFEYEPAPGDPLSREELTRLRDVLRELEAKRLVSRKSPWDCFRMASCVRGVQLLILTGARIGEISGVSVREVRLQQQHILRTNTKTGTRSIPLCREACELVAGQLEWVVAHDHPYVFPSPMTHQRPVTVDGLDITFRLACRLAQVENRHPHDLRHTFAFDAIAAGASETALARALGHRYIETTRKVYGRHNVLAPESLFLAQLVEQSRGVTHAA